MEGRQGWEAVVELGRGGQRDKLISGGGREGQGSYGKNKGGFGADGGRWWFLGMKVT